MSFRLTILFFSSPMSYTMSICTRSYLNCCQEKDFTCCQQIVICIYKRFPSHIAFQNVNLSVWKKFPIDFMQWMVLLENLNFLSKCEGNSSCQGNFILVSHLNTFFYVDLTKYYCLITLDLVFQGHCAKIYNSFNFSQCSLFVGQTISRIRF